MTSISILIIFERNVVSVPTIVSIVLNFICISNTMSVICNIVPNAVIVICIDIEHAKELVTFSKSLMKRRNVLRRLRGENCATFLFVRLLE